MYIYCDESGDTGWTFDKPFLMGGSSHFLTISFLLIPRHLRHLPKRVVSDLYSHKKHLVSQELKGSHLSTDDERYLASRVVALLKSTPDVSICSITVNKHRVQPHLRTDPNKLYNYMMYLCILDRIKSHPEVTIFPDLRSIKVKSGNSLLDYLQIKLWYEMSSETHLLLCPQDSRQSRNIQFIDYIAHIVWSHYEKGKSPAFDILKNHISLSTLFF